MIYVIYIYIYIYSFIYLFIIHIYIYIYIETLYAASLGRDEALEDPWAFTLLGLLLSVGSPEVGCKNPAPRSLLPFASDFQTLEEVRGFRGYPESL